MGEFRHFFGFDDFTLLAVLTLFTSLCNAYFIYKNVHKEVKKPEDEQNERISSNGEELTKQKEEITKHRLELDNILRRLDRGNIKFDSIKGKLESYDERLHSFNHALKEIQRDLETESEHLDRLDRNSEITLKTLFTIYDMSMNQITDKEAKDKYEKQRDELLSYTVTNATKRGE